jgi:hypothetical protein
MAANRQDNIFAAFRKTWGRGGVFGYYQGLIPWVQLFSILMLTSGMD